MTDYNCYFDGSCEPRNPGGNMGIGALITTADGLPVAQHTDTVPAHPGNTNNIAEYRAFYWVCDSLINLIRLDRDFEPDAKAPAPTVTINGDSMLVVMQMLGKWKMKGGKYIKDALTAREKLDTLKSVARVNIQWVPRHMNQQADDLSKSNTAVGAASKVTKQKA